MVNRGGYTKKAKGGFYRSRASTEIVEQGAPLATSSKHIIGAHWADRFLYRNEGFKRIYIRYQGRAQAVESDDVELQVNFL